jgi:glyoxylase-like metal-dependent hydrolase (beta-lactamase superfamily II)
VVIDPGGDEEIILRRIEALGVRVTHVLLTHAHFDHVLAARALERVTGAAVCLHSKDRRLYGIMPLQYKLYGIKAARPPRPKRWLKDNDEIRVGDLRASVIHTPGHSPGSCTFYFAEEKLLFAGDTLFRESVGIWTAPGGSFEALLDSVKKKLFSLPDDTRVIPGHLGETTILHEKQHNLYLKPQAIESARSELKHQPLAVKGLMSIINCLLGVEKHS